LASFFDHEKGRALTLITVVVFFVLGAAHMNKLGFHFSAFRDSLREYAMVCSAGALFGWLLLDAAKAFKEKLFFSPDPALFPRVETLAIVSALVFVVVLHQFRYFLNDGPANMAIGAGLLANHLFGKNKAVAPQQSEGHYERLEILRMQSREEGFTKEVLGGLAKVHAKLGNRAKTDFVLECLGLLNSKEEEK
jgi:hypothetical protein